MTESIPEQGMTLLILVVDDEPDVELLFRQHFRRDLRARRWRAGPRRFSLNQSILERCAARSTRGLDKPPDRSKGPKLLPCSIWIRNKLPTRQDPAAKSHAMASQADKLLCSFSILSCSGGFGNNQIQRA